MKNELEIVRNQTNRLHEETAVQINKLIAKGKETDASTQKLSEAINDAEHKAIEAWGVYHNGLMNMEKELSNVLSNITENLTQYNELTNSGMKEQLVTFDNAFAKAAEQIRLFDDVLNEGITLYDYQNEAVEWMYHAWQKGYTGVLLADDMGLGKTLQTLSFLAKLKKGIN